MLAPQIKKEKIENLPFLLNKIAEKNNNSEIPSHALLIGAGCSVSCRIPLGSTLIELCKMHSFIIRNVPHSSRFFESLDNRFDCEEILKKIKEKQLYDQYCKFLEDSIVLLEEKVNKDRAIHEQHISQILLTDHIEWEEYRPFINKDSEYGFWLDRYSEDPRERQKFIEHIIDNNPPNGAYIFLSYLIEKGLFSNILTTNFDDLINEALTYYTDVRCRFYADDELSQYISIHSSKPNIIKLHGDYRFANLKNTLEETDHLSENLKSKFEEILSQLGLIIIGYNGADHSIMNTLNEIKKKWKFSLVWCGKDANNVHWRVAQLINNTNNSYFVQIESFDALIGQLATAFLSDPPKDLVQKAKEKMKEVGHFLDQFKINFRKSDVSEIEKEKLEQTIDKWEILKKANESTIDDEKLKWYNEFIKIDDTSPVAFKNRGFIYRKFNQYAQAISDYTRAIDLTDDNRLKAAIYSLRAEVYFDLDEYIKAKEDCDASITFDQTHMYSYNNRGFAFLFLKDYNRAIDDFKKAIELEADYKNPHCHICVAYAKNKDYENALKNVNKAIELSPFYGRAFFNRGKIYEILGKKDLAIQDFDQAKEMLSDEVYKEQEEIWS